MPQLGKPSMLITYTCNPNTDPNHHPSVCVKYIWCVCVHVRVGKCV